ncbi:MAG: hypothetical protein IKE94_16625 [Aeriscardovia sp.]|nr:hypothetical protein [Aeriscardovia sp.]
MAQQPSLMKIPFAQNGAKATIPETTTSLGVASLSQGFPTETQLPLADGGVPPRRIDVNGALYMLSTFAMYQQTGGKFAWSSELDYDVPCIIYHNSNLWWCVQANGLSTNIVEPGTNRAYWIPFKEFVSSPLDAYPVGAYYISSDPTSPATLFGGTWERIQDRMIVAAGSTFTAGTTGGSTAKTLSVQNMPYHNHSCDTQGGHTHTRGSMNITAYVETAAGEGIGAFEHPSGSFYGNSYGKGALNGSGGSSYTITHGLVFDASRSWYGETSGNGWHSHNIGYNGNGLAFDVMNPYIVAYVWRRTA